MSTYPLQVCPHCHELKGEFKSVYVTCSGQYRYAYECSCGWKFTINGVDPKIPEGCGNE